MPQQYHTYAIEKTTTLKTKIVSAIAIMILVDQNSLSSKRINEVHEIEERI